MIPNTFQRSDQSPKGYPLSATALPPIQECGKQTLIETGTKKIMMSNVVIQGNLLRVSDPETEKISWRYLIVSCVASKGAK